MNNEYIKWKSVTLRDNDLNKELIEMNGKPELIEDAFGRHLTFGTGGLRGILGAGTNRMNIYTVRKATFGLAFALESGSSVAIAYDSRIKSDLFAKEAATVLANCKMKVYLFDRVSPTPLLSFAVRQLKCDAGIVITASHNPSNYNGYKVYNSKGCQINPETADLILQHINKTDIFYELPGETDFDTCLNKGLITYIDDSLIEDFIDTVCKQAFYDGSKRIKIVYTPLNGSGYECVSGAMEKRGFKNFLTVREQMHPDGRFPTCPYPNPEVREALQLGIRDLINSKSDILIATDPDCDRAGLAVRKDNQAVILNGNEVGILLLDYICMMRKKKNIMPKCPVAVKTIVTTELATKIAEHYGVTVIDTLTGFKFIGDQIAILEEKGREDSFIFAFEESCGYLSGTYVRDKDAVNAAVLIADMADYYNDKDISLLDRLEELYKQFGYLISYLGNYEYPGTAGLSKMRSIMENLRKSALLTKDYLNETDMLHADVLKFVIEDLGTAIVRPSGTEPKIKIYYFAEGCDMIDAKEKMKKLTVLIERMLN
ncbi:MAG TPA: phospho-sugar mutase [Clostridia bacterium]|jgi:phosphoglucomutase|nr:phospho-sugar mutase [Clostridia bacterium]HQC67502.1 phospho-sugar mutase [Clostridia bacterium]